MPARSSKPRAPAQAPMAAAPFAPSQQMGSNALEPRDGPTGIETMAEFVGQGDFLGIPLPDGSNLGATPAIEPSPSSYYEDTPNNNGLTPAQQAALDAFYAQYPNGFDLNLGNIGSEGGFGAIGNDFDQQYGEDFGSLIGFGPVGVEGGWSYDGNGNEINGGPAGGEEPAVDNTPNNNGLTPAQQAGLDAFYAQYPNGLDLNLGLGSIGSEGGYGDTPGFSVTNPNAGQDWYENMTDEQRDAYDAFIANGGIYGGGFLNIIPGSGGTTKRPVPVVEAIQNLTVNRDPGAAQSSVATQYGLTGAPPVQAPSTNPFQRPETQQGIGSLAGGG
jgi:hypothetical protein